MKPYVMGPFILAAGFSKALIACAWHVLLSLAAGFELFTAQTKFRKFLLWMAVLWHVIAAFKDWFGW